MYIRGMEVQALPGAEVLADLVPSYFDRTWDHFCSHRQTPSAGVAGNPAAVRSGDVIYFSSPLFTLYQKVAPLWCKRLLLNALEMLLPAPLVRHNGPSTLFVTLNEQATQQRLVVHLLHYIPERRGVYFDTIEDVIPLFDLQVAVRTDRPVAAVKTAPEGQPLAFEVKDGRVTFALPRLDGHQMVTIDFADQTQ